MVIIYGDHPPTLISGRACGMSLYFRVARIDTPIHLYQGSDEAMNQDCNTPIHRYINTPMHRYIDTPIHLYQ